MNYSDFDSDDYSSNEDEDYVPSGKQLLTTPSTFNSYVVNTDVSIAPHLARKASVRPSDRVIKSLCETSHVSSQLRRPIISVVCEFAPLRCSTAGSLLEY